MIRRIFCLGTELYTPAEMTELADVQDLGSCAVRREGSSPFFRMKNVYSFLGKEKRIHVFIAMHINKWSSEPFLSFNISCGHSE